MKSSAVRPLTGLAMIVAIGLIIAVAIGLFRGSFTKTEPVTVLSDRAGLVMNNDAKVKMRGVEVGRVDSIESRPDGKAALRLAMNPSQLHLIPSNVDVNIESPTVFGAKSVNMVPPDDPSPQPLRPGQVIQSQHVVVEINTVFQQLVQVLDKIDPAKLNQTLGRDRDGVRRPRREVRQDADRLQRIPGQDRTEPAESQPRPRSRGSDTGRVRGRRARPHQDRRQHHTDQQYHRRTATRA